MMPATAPTEAARPQPSASIQSTRTPTRRAICGFCAAARMASPSGVKRKKANSRPSTIRVTSTTPSWCGPITPAMPKLLLGNGDGYSLIR